MNELLKVNYDNDRITLSARELHKGLNLTERFSNWFERMTQYGFDEGVDYLGCKTFNTQAHQELQDYQITIDMAKHIAMVQRNEAGRKFRDYFIQVENEWNKPERVMARALVFANNQIESLKLDNKFKDEQIIEMKPKALFADAVASSHTSILVGELAKLLKQNGYEIGAIRLFEKLREEGYLIKRNGSDWNMPTQKSMELGLFEIKESTSVNADGSIRTNRTPKVTGKGQVYFINKYIGGNKHD